jgi:putative nucleotidyltransferase with HDIG domain
MVAQEVLAILADDPNSLGRLEQTIRHDPSIASQLLKVANCAAYAPLAPVDTVHRAIVYLGFMEVRNVALGLAIYSIFRPGHTVPDFDVHAFWTHSMATAIVARLLAVEVGEEQTEVLFTAGLLHDIGRLALNACFPEDWSHILKEAKANDLPLLLAERRAGLPHTLLGGWLAKSWGLPRPYVNSVAGHHLPPSHPRWTRICGIVQLADHVCHNTQMGLFPGPPLQETPLVHSLGLTADSIHSLQEQISLMEGIAETVSEILG